MNIAGLTDEEAMLSAAAADHARSWAIDRSAPWAQLIGHGWVELLHQAPGQDGSELPLRLLYLPHALGEHGIESSFLPFASLSLQLLQCVPPSRWLSGHADGTGTIATAWLETGGDPLGREIACSLTRNGSTLALNGTKRFVLAAQLARFAIVTAMAGDDLRLAVVPLDAEGVAITQYTLIDGSPAADLYFNNVELPADGLLVPHDGAGSLDYTLEMMTIAALGEAVGCLDAALAQTIEHVKLRCQFGAPLASLQVVRHRIADMYIAIEQFRSLALDAARTSDPMERTRAISVAKIYLGRRGIWAAEQAVQLHGAMGVTHECAIGWYLKRLIVLERLLGGADYHAAELSREFDGGGF